jgi:hypothetical protein
VNHPSPDTFELYAIGALEGVEAGAFEEHVAACRRCADVLAREALVEVRLREAAERLDRNHASLGFSRGRQARLWWGGGAGLALAASLLLLAVFSGQGLGQRLNPRLGHWRSPPRFDEVPAVEAVPGDTRDQLLARNNGVALEGLDEPMEGSDRLVWPEAAPEPSPKAPMGRGAGTPFFKSSRSAMP